MISEKKELELKMKFHLEESYKLYNKHFGTDKDLHRKILKTDAYCIKFSNPEKAIALWKQIIEINL
jgi:hypothetical protein